MNAINKGVRASLLVDMAGLDNITLPPSPRQNLGFTLAYEEASFSKNNCLCAS